MLDPTMLYGFDHFVSSKLSFENKAIIISNMVQSVFMWRHYSIDIDVFVVLVLPPSGPKNCFFFIVTDRWKRMKTICSDVNLPIRFLLSFNWANMTSFSDIRIFLKSPFQRAPRPRILFMNASYGSPLVSSSPGVLSTLPDIWKAFFWFATLRGTRPKPGATFGSFLKVFVVREGADGWPDIRETTVEGTKAVTAWIQR